MKATLLDTCSLLWWTLDPQALSPKAQTVCQDFENIGVFVSAISIWELGIKVRTQKLDMGISIESYAQKLKEISYLTILSVDIDTWVTSIGLNWSHKDPVDRVIVASALLNNCQILTTDRLIIDFYPHVVS